MENQTSSGFSAKLANPLLDANDTESENDKPTITSSSESPSPSDVVPLKAKIAYGVGDFSGESKSVGRTCKICIAHS